MEDYYRKDVEFSDSTINFQSLDWSESNEEPYDVSGSETEETSFYSQTKEKYIIRCFGVSDHGHSVCVNIENFTPFYFVKVPMKWKKKDINPFIDNLIETEIKSKKDNLYFAMKRFSDSFVRSKCILVNKKDFYGFTGEKEYRFLRLVFNNSYAFSTSSRIIAQHNEGKCRIKGINFILKLYESNLNPVLKFFHLKNIQPTNWITCNKFTFPEEKVSNCQIEISADWSDLQPFNNKTSAKILQASFDIETDSSDGHSFPSPYNKEDSVIQIATSFKVYGEKDFLVKHLITLKNCSPIESSDGIPIIIESYNTEKEVILAWKKLLVKMSPDIIYGYNSDSFDFWYIHERSVLLRCNNEFLKLGKLISIPGKLELKTFTSSAYGTTEYRRLKIPGIINFDILIFLQREYKLTSYKLDNVAKLYLNENKVPMDIKEMFRMFKRGRADDISEIGLYCVQDTCLPQKLVDNLLIFQTQISMSNVSFVPVKYLIERGQQIKTFSLITKSTSKLNYLVPVINNIDPDEINDFKKPRNIDSDSDDDYDDDNEFVGATVLKPMAGCYYEPVVTLDFKSLYPSIMMAHNMCYSTIVEKDKYLNLPGYMYNTHNWTDPKKDDKGKVITDSEGIPLTTEHSITFATKENIQGILPNILQGLVNSRQEYKDLMKTAYKSGDKMLGDVYDKNQQAVKVTMNSIYGFVGAQMLPCKKIAATVTAVGRQMIAGSKEYVETNYIGSEVVYGDSVTGDTPILLRDRLTKRIFIKTIDSICENWVEYPEFKMFDETIRLEKQYSTTYLEVWSDKGWNPIKKLIRHKTSKKIYRVLTHTGCVDVTEDHSLCNEKGEKVKPTEVKVGDNLLHSFPTEFNEIKETKVFMKKKVLETFKCKGCNIEQDVNNFYKASNIKRGYSSQCKDCLYYKKSTHPVRNIMKDFKFENYILTENEAKCWGFFQGDGSCGKYTCKSGVKASWALNNNDLVRLNYFKDLLEKIEPVKFKILDTLNSSGVYKLVPVGSLIYMVDKYRKLFYDTFDCNAEGDKYKIVPNCILNASKEIKTAYWEGYHEADGGKTNGYNNKNPSFAVKGKIGAMCMYYLIRSIGFDMYLNLSTHPKKQEMYWLNMIKDTKRSKNNIKKIIEKRQVNTEEFVYDIETEFGKFNAGVGQLTIANTDSLFLQFNTKLQRKYEEECKNEKTDKEYLNKLKREVIAEAMELGKKAGKELTKSLFKYPISLDFEKVNMPCILLSKKRYIINKYEENADEYKQTSKGIVLNRRDNFKLIKELYTSIVDIVMNMVHKDSKDKLKIYELIENTIQGIINTTIDLDKLIITKTYKPVKKNENLPQIALVKKLTERDPAGAPRYNDKIPYVIIDTNSLTPLPQYQKVEDPDYVKERGLSLDAEYYINYLEKPISELLKFFIENPNDLFKIPLKQYKIQRKEKIMNKLTELRENKRIIIKRKNKI